MKFSELSKVKKCTKCLYTELHPLGITFDRNGLCSGCKIHAEKESIEWNKREQKLFQIIQNYKNDKSYDCIVPVSSGQDSFFVLHYVTKVLKINPLVVNFNRVMNSREAIINFARLREKFAVDVHQVTMSAETVKKVIKVTLENLGTINWYWIAGQTALPVRTAVDLNIPLIIWGAHQGVEQVGMFSYYDEVEMTKKYRNEHDLMGYDEDRILNFDCDFDRDDIALLRYPSDQEILKSQVRGIYLSNFIRWDPIEQHKLVVKEYGYLGRRVKRTYYQFDNPDCPVYMCLQDELKMLKFGYSKVTDQVCREIRFGRMSRTLAKAINFYFSRRSTKSCNRKFELWLGASSGSLDLVKLKHSRPFLPMLEKVDKNIIKSAKRNHFNNKDYNTFGKGTK